MSNFYTTLAILQETLPFFILFLVPLRDRLRFSNKINIPVVIFYLIFCIYLFSQFLKMHREINIPLPPLSLSFMVIGILLCRILLKGRQIINVFILFIIRGYLDIVYMTEKSSYMFHFLQYGHTALETAILAKCLLTLFTFPLVYLFIIELLKPSIDHTEQSHFWKWLWFIPVLFYLCFYIVIYPIYEYHWEFQGPAALFLPFIWLFATFLTYYLILHILGEAPPFAEMEETLQLSEIQAAIQKQQYEDLQENIEKTKAARHDMRHILLALEGYLEKGDLDGFRGYIREYQKEHPLDEE